MDWKIEHIENENYIKITLIGLFTIADHNEFFTKLLSSDFWKPGTNLLFNGRNLDFTSLNSTLIRGISDYFQSISEQLGKNKIALLASSSLGYGFGRQFQMLSENKVQSEIRVFRVEREAAEWLNE